MWSSASAMLLICGNIDPDCSNYTALPQEAAIVTGAGDRTTLFPASSVTVSTYV